MQALRCGELTPFYREVVLKKMAALENEVTREMVRAQEEKEKAAALRANLNEIAMLLTAVEATERKQKSQIASLMRILQQLLGAQKDLGTDLQDAVLDLLAGTTGSSSTSLINTLLVGARTLSGTTASTPEPTRQVPQPQGDVRMGRRAAMLAEAARGRAQWAQRSERWRCHEAVVDATWPSTAAPWTCRCGAVWTLVGQEGSPSPGDSDADSPSPRGTASSTDSHSRDGLASNADSETSTPPRPSTPRPPTPPPVTDDLSRFPATDDLSRFLMT